jgi:hypothetical protein
MLLVLTVPASTSADTVVMSDGSKVEGVLAGAGGGEIVLKSGSETRRIGAGDVLSVEMGTARVLMAEQGRWVAVAEDGSRLGLDRMTIAEGKVKCLTAMGETSMPIQSIACILMPGSHERPMDVEPMPDRLGIKRGDSDVVIVSSGGGQNVAVKGVVLRASGGELVIEYEGVESPLPAATVRAIVMAKVAAPTNPASASATVTLVDGSTLRIESLAAAGAGFAARSPLLGSLVVPRSAIALVCFASKMAVFLSDLDPSVRQTGFFDETFTWKRNRAVSGGPLEVGGRAFEKGIGVHARCELTYTLGGAYRGMSAIAGIDDSVRSGAAMLSVVGDGKVLFGPALLDRGRPPVELRVDLKGVGRMTILADFAEGTVGSGARVDLCGATLVK